MPRLEINEEVDAMLKSVNGFRYRLHEPFFNTSDELAEVAAQFLAIPSPQKPRQWRLNAWKKVTGVVLRNVDMHSEHTEYLSGLGIGVFHLLSLDESQENKNGDAAYSPEEIFSSRMSWLDGAKDSTMKEISDDPEKLGRFHQGYSDGLNKIYSKDDRGNYTFINYTDATGVYLLLLKLADYLDTLDSVAEAYDVLTAYPQIAAPPHDIESFKKLCYRLGFTGQVHREKAMDRG